MRLSSSLSGTSKGESAPPTLALENFGKLELFACGVRASFEDDTIADLVDFGVPTSILSIPYLCCLGVLEAGCGLFFCSEYGLGGVIRKFFKTWLPWGFVEGSCLSNQFHHHGNPPDRTSDPGVWVEVGVAFHNCRKSQHN